MTSPLRILHLPDTISYRNGRMSVIMNIYKHLDRNKVQFDFLVTDNQEENYQGEIERLGGHVYFAPSSIKATEIRGFSQHFFATHHYKIIHYHAITPWQIAINVARKFGNPKIIVHSHSTKFGETFLKSVRNRIFRLPALQWSQQNIACSKAAGDIFFEKHKFRVLNNAVETDRFRYDVIKRRAIRKQLGITNQIFVLGNVGRFSKQKNQNYLLRIFAQYHKINPQSVLLLIGSGRLEHELHELADQLKISNAVIFTGEKKILRLTMMQWMYSYYHQILKDFLYLL